MVTRVCAILSVLVCLLLHPGQAAAEQASPFAATGLLSNPTETAEEVLLRAHRRDTPAMALAAAGYARGIGGFPPDVYLATAWAEALFENNAFETGALMALLLWEGADILDDDLGIRLVQCALAQNSSLAQKFAEAALFDVKTYCAALEKRKKTTPGWERRSKVAQDTIQTLQAAGDKALRVMRDLPSRPATPDDEIFLKNALAEFSLDTLIFYAATTHDPERGIPDWSAERLFALLDVCRAAAARKEQSALATILPAVDKALINGLSENPEKALQTIRAAHNAPPLPAQASDASGITAVREMARFYGNGSFGFLKSDALARAWLLSAALDDDPQSTLLLAIELFSTGSLADAWHWARTLASHHEAQTDSKRIAESIIKKVERLNPNGLTPEEYARISGYQKAKKNRLEWRIAQSKGQGQDRTP